MDTIKGTKAAPVDLGDVLVLGLGKSGRAVALYCLDLLGTRAKSLTIAAGEMSDEAFAFARSCEDRGAKVFFEQYTFDGSYDLCIASPGISQFSRFYENAAKVSREVISEVEFAWRESPAESSWIAVTGTNGKTTTTTLITHIFQTAGERVAAVGNIGNTAITAVGAHAADVYVVEVSSFQLASMSQFAPQVAVLLNITPDHLYWHMTFDAYVEAKKNVYRNLGQTQGTLVIDATCPVTRQCLEQLAECQDGGFDVVALGGASGIEGMAAAEPEFFGKPGMTDAGAFRRQGRLVCRIAGQDHDLADAGELNIKGEHHASNARAAAAAALAFGLSDQAVAEGLRTFRPLEHRLEPCGTINGVEFFNDSKATNVDATLKALSAFKPGEPIFLLGGHDKGTDLAELVQECEKICKAVVCVGAAAERFMAAFATSGLTHVQEEHLEDALDRAILMAEPGDCVVLSPACASFDEFDSFEHRGKVFKGLVSFRCN